MNKILLINNCKCCSRCNRLKDISQFYSTKGRVKSWCKSCFSKDTTKRSIKESETLLGNTKSLLRTIRTRSRKQKLLYELTVDFIIELYIKQQGLCAISGEKLTYGHGNGRIPTNMSVDKITPEKGYTKDNVQLVCSIVNIMKQEYPQASLVNWCNKILLWQDNGHKE